MSRQSEATSFLGNLLRTSRLAALLEIIVVFIPLSVGLVISDAQGIEHTRLGGRLILKGGPAVYVGLVLSLVLLWASAKLRGADWHEIGLTRTRAWWRTVLLSLVVALAVLGAVVLVINPVVTALPGVPPRDMSSFSFTEGDLVNLVLNVAAMWFTAAFVEELIWRGYLMNRLVDVLGRRTRLAWAVALVLGTVIFGLAHAYQGPVGVLKTGAVGLVLGVAYLALGRNLWPLILAHGLIDTLDFVTHYLGG